MKHNIQSVSKGQRGESNQATFFEIALRHRCSPVNLLYIFRTPFPRNTSGRLLLNKIPPLLNPSSTKSVIWKNNKTGKWRQNTTLFVDILGS